MKAIVNHFTNNSRCHHLETCLDAPSSSTAGLDPMVDHTVKELVRRDEQYSEAFRVAYEKAGARVKDATLRPRSERMSAKAGHFNGAPWLMAQVDVYEMIIESLVKTHSLDVEVSHFHAVADVGQSTHRGAVCLQGTIPSLSTSSRIFSYKLNRCRP